MLHIINNQSNNFYSALIIMPRASTNDTLKLKTKLTKTQEETSRRISQSQRQRQQKTGQKDQSDK